MATANLEWVAGGGGGAQDVSYKRRQDSGWTPAATGLSPTATTLAVPNLLDNVIYDFRVENKCSGGASTFSPVISNAFIGCPVVSPSAGSTTVSFSFIPLSGDVSRYVVDLLEGANVVDTKVINAPFGSSVSGTFTGKPSNTNFYLRVTVYVGQNYEYSKVCPTVTQATGSPSACASPTNVQVQMVQNNMT